MSKQDEKMASDSKIKEPVSQKKLRFVEIEWYDAVQGDSWAKLHEKPDASVSKCTTRGWIIHEDERQIIIAATLGLNEEELVEDVNTSIALPKGMIVNVRDFPRKRAVAKKKHVTIEEMAKKIAEGSEK